ncbi:MAG TPA: hypothetical protein VKR58_13305 [Aquella sp.]|nr:hypothetical protein [Aquella sp.]
MERLLKLLQENKITEEEFHLLSNALTKKSNLFIRLATFLLNPFLTLSPKTCLVIGIVVTIFLGGIGWHLNMIFSGFAGAEPTTIRYPVYHVYLELICSWLIFTMFFLIFSLLFKVRISKVFDFFAFIAIAKTPYLVLMLICLILNSIDPSLITLTAEQAPNITYKIFNLIFSIMFYLFWTWQIILYFNAYKESSGLSGDKVWPGFIISALTTNIILNTFLN